ncbi:MAG: HAMP domain-containing sensor histidine kinase [Myxococcota bacterium]
MDEDPVPFMGRDPNALRSDGLRLLTHDLNNPLTAIRILAEMLRDQVHDPEQRQDIIDILEAADLASVLMEGMRSFVMMEGRDADYTWFPIDLVNVLRESCDRPALRRHVRFQLPRELQMNGDRVALQRTFTDLFLNARRLVDGRRQLLVDAEEYDHSHVVRIHLPGATIAPHQRARIFEPYGAVELRQQRLPVAASGLTFARSVIEVHGGQVLFEDVPEGTVLAVRLPR